MIKVLRRYFWLISAFAKQYWILVSLSLIFSLALGFFLVQLNKSLPDRQITYRLGVIGVFTNQNLPPLVKNILNAGLTKVGADFTIVPNLADSWEVSSDGKTYTFYLKDGLKWDDGRGLTSDQVSLTIPSVQVEHPDPKTLKFSLPEAFAPFPAILTSPVTDLAGHTASNYKVSLTQSSNGSISLITLTSQKLKIIIRVFPNSTSALTAYKLGELDAIFGLPKNEDLNTKNQGFVKETENAHQSIAIFFNTHDSILKSKGLRQGLAYLLSDKTMGNTRSLSPITHLSWAYNPLVKAYDFDQQRALTLIRENLPNKGEVLNLELATLPAYLSVAENLKKQLDSDLVKINIKVVTSRPDNFQLFLSLFEMPIDPDQYVFWHSTQVNNKSKLDNERIDKDLEDGRRALNQNERKRIYADFQRTFTEELPAIFLFHPHYVNLARNEALFAIIDPATAH